MKRHIKIGLLLTICAIYPGMPAQSPSNAGKLLEQGLRHCDVSKLAAFYAFLEENDFKDFDYSKNAEKFFQCGAAATKLWVEKGDGTNPVDLKKNTKDFFPNFFYRAFIENNDGAIEELLKHSDHETIQKIFEAYDNGGRILLFGQSSFSCPLKFFELFVKYGASVKGRMILTLTAFKNEETKIKKLLELGADVNEVDSKGNTALADLFTGLFFSSTMRTLKELLRHNPDVSIKNNDGKTASDLAQEQIEKNCTENSKHSSTCKEFTEALAQLKQYQKEQDKKAQKTT